MYIVHVHSGMGVCVQASVHGKQQKSTPGVFPRRLLTDSEALWLAAHLVLVCTAPF